MRLISAVFFCALAALPALPASALPASGAPVVGDYHLRTAITQLYGSQYPVSGDLDLHVTPDGLVSGFYHPAGVREFIPIVGGLDGSRIWFDIDGATRLRVTGTIDGGGTIQAGATREAPAGAGVAQVQPQDDATNLLPDQFDFTAVAR